MPRSRPKYALEFRQKMVELVRAGRNSEKLDKEFGPTAQTIRNWVARACCLISSPTPDLTIALISMLVSYK